MGIPLKQWDIRINRGILTGYNEAFIISTEKKNELIKADPHSAEIIRPILRGRDIKRYGYTFANLWLINVHNGIKAIGLPPIDIDDYPAIKNHLLNYYDKLASRADKGNTPFNLRNCVYMNDFFQQKIVYREISEAMDACLVGSGIMLNNKCYLITGEHLEYLLAFFNSKIFTKVILPSANITGGKGQTFLSGISSIYPTEEVNTKIHTLLHERNSSSAEGAILIDEKIDEIFYNLYGLNKSEISFLQEG